ncbi:MAG: type II secretion system F family protein [Candidatus Omnitrophica bacterium]|nr:type II secretion system F family protein [Candidatus Omnitrophota bacterium]
MPSFQYIAKDKFGTSMAGIIEAASEGEAVEVLHGKELIIVSVEQAKKKQLKAAVGRSGKKIKLDDLVVFSRQLSTMIDTGIPVVQSLAILSEQTENPSLKSVVGVVKQDIEAGMSFSDALAKHPQVFSDLFINMTKAGETSGMLDEVLDRLASYLEKAAALTRKVKASLVYPAVVISMAILITGVLMIKVVPTFKGIFEILGGTLPLPTRILIGVSDAIRAYFLFFIILLIIAVVLFRRYISTEKGRYNFDAFQLKVAVLGPLTRKVAVAKFSRTFATLVRSGVAILNALEIVAHTSGNKVVEKAVMDSRSAVREGETIAKPLLKSGVFPPMVCRMIGIGEQTGQLEKMLTKIADFYDEQVDAAVSALTSLIEPLVISFLGIVIGGIVVSLFMPIFKITELVGK